VRRPTPAEGYCASANAYLDFGRRRSVSQATTHTLVENPRAEPPMTTLCRPHDNRILASLAAPDYERLRPHLEVVELEFGRSIYEPGSELAHVYFPTTAIISILNLTEDGDATETALVGREGLVSIATYLGGGWTVGRAVVQVGGVGVRVPSPVIVQDFEQARALRQVLLRYTQALLTQMAQTAVCNRHHELAQQLCRWILATHDRVSTPEIPMTHQLIADMLGVRREGVTEAARRLKQAGLIDYVRGRIRVVDRAGLEAAACECYGLVREEYARLLD
jgi:CRP-like cAMP-binding protein